jgi:hypothetical protein
VDYSRLIEGYDRMTPAERVKAKMKLQLSETGFGPLFVYVLVFPVCSVK